MSSPTPQSKPSPTPETFSVPSPSVDSPLTPNPIIEGFQLAQSEAGRIAREHGFKEEAVGTKLMLMVGEISEAMEEYRNGIPVTDMYYDKDGKPEGVPIELADCIIRILSFADAHGINMGWAVALKMKFNDGRPYMHGGKRF